MNIVLNFRQLISLMSTLQKIFQSIFAMLTSTTEVFSAIFTQPKIGGYYTELKAKSRQEIEASAYNYIGNAVNKSKARH